MIGYYRIMWTILEKLNCITKNNDVKILHNTPRTIIYNGKRYTNLWDTLNESEKKAVDDHFKKMEEGFVIFSAY
jgi:hypothetical protein